MFDLAQLRDEIIKPALQDLIMLSDEAVELMLFTCAVESDGGTYIKQIKGRALGIYQMEPETYNDIWTNYIPAKQSLKLQLIHRFNAPTMPDEYRLVYDLRFATAMTRIHYFRVAERLPNLHDLVGLWNYYKNYYNTSQGKANYNDSMLAYQRFRKAKP